MHSNKHISEYLDYFTELESPGYAVLLRGSWGAGKTWFIKEYIKQREDRFLYISLYGLNSIRDIEDAFFQFLHPILSSKGAKITGKIMTGLLKTTLKIDLGKDEMSFSPSLGNIDFSDFLKKIDNKILIFDDLERCQIPIVEFLGYVNQFIENSNSKVILLANEEMFIKNAPNDSNYVRNKEKVIGKAFEIKSNFSEAIKKFIEDIRDSDAKLIIDSRVDIIHQIYIAAKHDNLRHLRYAILDFERFLHFLPSEAIAKQNVIDDILRLFFAVSFELNRGNITEDKIIDFLSSHYFFMKETELTDIQKIRRKYGIEISQPPISSNFLFDYFTRGTMDKTELKKGILSSVYFQDENTPDWSKLRNLQFLTDDEFESLLSKVWSKYTKTEIQDKFELIETARILLSYSNEKIITKTTSDIMEAAVANINNLKRNGGFIRKKNELKISIYFEATNPERENRSGDFANFIKLITDAENDSEEESYNDRAQKLLLSLNNNSFDEFINLVTITNSGDTNDFAEIPIFKYIDVKDFFNSILGLNGFHKLSLAHTLKKRYSFSEVNQKLVDELNWLCDLHNFYEKEKEKFDDKLSRFYLSKLFDTELPNIILLLKNSIPKTNAD